MKIPLIYVVQSTPFLAVSPLGDFNRPNEYPPLGGFLLAADQAVRELYSVNIELQNYGRGVSL